MPRLGPVKRNDLIFYLKRLGFRGPYSGGKHRFMIRSGIRLRIPNPHESNIGREFLVRILRQAGVPIDDWEKL
jgi:predicted RNA binding protein YcfA (HicA-like mRNA interferase family)